MRQRMISIIFSGVLLFCSISFAVAEEATEKTMKQDEQGVDHQAETDQGRGVVVQRIQDQFHVDDKTIQNLRKKHMGYGEITTLLSLTSRMEGGITQDNIDKITDMRQGSEKKGWGEIARQFNVKVGDLRRSVKNVEEGEESTMKQSASHSQNLSGTTEDGAQSSQNSKNQKMSDEKKFSSDNSSYHSGAYSSHSFNRSSMSMGRSKGH